MIIEGKAERPIIPLIEDNIIEFLDAKEFWGLNTLKLKTECSVCGTKRKWCLTPSMIWQSKRLLLPLCHSRCSLRMVLPFQKE
ncbi:hypothetical protein KEJ37_00840 [Candidatus Bathyarchaeota archaeon]|nr:hypothetical protein [Candidatus Bathyarchaeota archaeon]